MLYFRDWSVQIAGLDLHIARTFAASPAIFTRQRDGTYLDWNDHPSVSDPLMSHTDPRSIVMVATKVKGNPDFEVKGVSFKVVDIPKKGLEIYDKRMMTSTEWVRKSVESATDADLITEIPIRPGQYLVFAYRKQER